MATIEAKGTEGSTLIFVDTTAIKIERKGFINMSANRGVGTRTISMSSINAVEFKDAGYGSGYIQLDVTGNKPLGVSKLIGAKFHKDRVYFTKKQQPQFDKIRELVEKEIYN